MNEDAVRLTLTLERRTGSAGIARRAVSNACSTAGREMLDEAMLLTSELITNAIVHTANRCELELYFDAGSGYLRVDVYDRSRVLPAIVDRPRGKGGLGLRLVDQISTRWGSTSTPSGKSVWFELGHDGPA